MLASERDTLQREGRAFPEAEAERAGDSAISRIDIVRIYPREDGARYARYVIEQAIYSVPYAISENFGQ